jgi:nucleolar GTP-binding protein
MLRDCAVANAMASRAQTLGLLHRLAHIFPAASSCAGAGAALAAPRRRQVAAAAAAAAAPAASAGGAQLAGAPAPADLVTPFDPDASDDDAPLPPPPAPARAPRRLPTTGAFQRLPLVAPSRELIDSALRRASRTPGSAKLRNEAARARNRAARCLDALMKELTAPLGAYERGFPPPNALHPFERALLDLTLGEEYYSSTLARVAALRRASVQAAKEYAARAGKAPSKRDAAALQAEGFAAVEAAYARGAPALEQLKEAAKALRRLPVVDPAAPAVALVGAPNVGKSSLVQLLSSGLPEVQDYPFTTRSIKVGHFFVDGRRHQVTDTPGLLPRPDEDRNAMERLTLASLAHLPTVVMFVADLTGACGTPVAKQWAIRDELRARFPGKPWLDVLSKADLLEEEFDEADALAAVAGGAAGAPAFGRGKSAGGADADAVAFAAAAHGALRVSSLTGGGIEGLKDAMLACLAEAAAAGALVDGGAAGAEAGVAAAASGEEDE